MAKKKKVEEKIVLDEESGLVFENKDQLFQHFESEITQLEDEFRSFRKSNDIPQKSYPEYEELLTSVLEDPDEIWEDQETLENQVLYHFLGAYEDEDRTVFYVAVAHMVEEVPVFVFLHFPTYHEEILEAYRRGEMIYDRTVKEVELGAVEGDALSEGDELAVGLYKSMLKVRSEQDVKEAQFHEFVHLRAITIEDADEIWRSTDYKGHVLVTFFKEFSDEEQKELYYLVVTVEDAPSNSHVLLFSFPTYDKHLVERYKHGENLQADEVVQESSH